MPEVLDKIDHSSNIKVDSSMENKYDTTQLFQDKFNKAIEHLKGRNINQELDQAFIESKSNIKD